MLFRSFAVPLLIIAAVAGPALTALKKARRFIPVFEKTTGILMVVVGLLLATDQFGLVDRMLTAQPSPAALEAVAPKTVAPSDGGAAAATPAADPFAPPAASGESCGSAGATQCDTALEPGRPAMLKFFSPNCPVCRQMIPTVGLLKNECSSHDVEFREVDISTPEGRILARTYGIRGIPVFVFVDGAGEEVSRLVGYQPLSALEQAMGVLTGEACPSEYRTVPGL